MHVAMRWITVGLLGVVGFAGLACDSSGNRLGGDPENAIADTQLMRRAQTAASDLLRNASDCEALRDAYPQVIEIFDEVAGSISTGAGRTSLGALRKQVEVAGSACGAQ